MSQTHNGRDDEFRSRLKAPAETLRRVAARLSAERAYKRMGDTPASQMRSLMALLRSGPDATLVLKVAKRMVEERGHFMILWLSPPSNDARKRQAREKREHRKLMERLRQWVQAMELHAMQVRESQSDPVLKLQPLTFEQYALVYGLAHVLNRVLDAHIQELHRQGLELNAEQQVLFESLVLRLSGGRAEETPLEQESRQDHRSVNLDALLRILRPSDDALVRPSQARLLEQQALRSSQIIRDLHRVAPDMPAVSPFVPHAALQRLTPETRRETDDDPSLRRS